MAKTFASTGAVDQPEIVDVSVDCATHADYPLLKSKFADKAFNVPPMFAGARFVFSGNNEFNVASLSTDNRGSANEILLSFDRRQMSNHSYPQWLA